MTRTETHDCKVRVPMNEHVHPLFQEILNTYARNSLMAAHFPEQLEAERKARRVIPQQDKE